MQYTAVCANPCQNGGTCVDINTCSCPTGYAGPSCENRKYNNYIDNYYCTV